MRLIGVEAAGEGEHCRRGAPLQTSRSDWFHLLTGIDTPKHSATLALGTPGVLHGVRTYLLQSPTGQIIESHSICAGLDYPGVGPEHAWLKDSGRAEYMAATDEQCLRGFRACTQMEGIIPALETAHAVWGTMQLAKTMPKDANVVMVSDSIFFGCIPSVRY